MTEPGKISAEAFDYELPEERIAKYPLKNREDSNLLIYQQGKISKDRFHQLTGYLPSDYLMVFNNAQVVYSRLLFRKITGANIEIFCLEPSNPAEYSEAFRQNKAVSWHCLVGNLKKWKESTLIKKIELEGKKLNLKATQLKRNENSVEILFEWDHPEVTFGEILDHSGNVPIPPYLKRESEEIDKKRYQTVYSKVKGSVAAPTAGLHFSKPVMDKLNKKGIRYTELTLHVGAGTFRPVKAKSIDQHEMHTEHFAVSKKALSVLKENQDKLLAVGTTSVRTMESLYWLGVKMKQEATNDPDLMLHQWDHLHLPQSITVKESLDTLISYLEEKNQEILKASTQIMIAPGYSFKLTKAMITNFHQPRSTLLMLIAAFVGDDWKSMYDYALRNHFRFLSYGDSSLLIP